MPGAFCLRFFASTRRKNSPRFANHTVPTRVFVGVRRTATRGASREPNPKPPNRVRVAMTLRYASTELLTGDSRLSGGERMLDTAAAKLYAVAGERSGGT